MLSARGVAEASIALPNGAVTGAGQIAIRPEHMRIAGAACANRLPARVRDRVYLGSKSRLLLETRAGEELMLYFDNGPGLPPPAPGEELHVAWETRDSFAL